MLTESHDLPPQPTPFMGRTRELKEITRLLTDPGCRLLTLVGPGGIGKTRIALEIGVQYISSICFVALQPLTSSEFIVSSIIDAIGFPFYSASDPKELLLHYLGEKSLLLLLDNFEHLLDGVELLSEIHRTALNVRMLVTSRERLGLVEEWVYEVEGLSLPTDTNELETKNESSLQFFVHSARRLYAGFTLKPKQKSSAIRICQLVGGMPLALELAASWTHVLSCEELAAEIERCLDILATTMRNIEPRHRNIRAVFDPTWQRLSDRERQVFMQLSVFRGGFTRKAAEAIAGASLYGLSELVNRSLVRMDAEGRYSIHELLRQYGEEHLKASDNLWQHAHDQHCHYYAEFLRLSYDDLYGNKVISVLHEIEIELDNIRACWAWALTHSLHLNSMLDTMWFFYDIGNRFQEGEQSFERAAIVLRAESADESRRLLLGKVLAQQGSLGSSLDQNEKAARLLQESLDILQESDAQNDLAFALSRMGINVFRTRGPQQAYPYLQQSLALYQQIGNQWGIGHALFWLGIVHEFNGKSEKAWETCQESLAIFQALGSLISIGAVKSQLSQIGLRMGHHAEALRLAHEGLEVFQAVGVIWGISMSYDRLALALIESGDYIQARAYILEALAVAIEYRLKSQLLLCLGRTARLRIFQGQFDRAVQIMSLLIMHLSATSSAKYVRLLEDLKSKLSAHAFAVAFKQGASYEIDGMAKELLAELQQEVKGGEAEVLPQPLFDPLTERELEILRLMASGAATHEIAKQLYLTTGTVRWYLKQIYSKLAVHSRIQALARARELKFL
jgi:predicted ATPase/DNA-binding CsgD family transcriptional regulator